MSPADLRLVSSECRPMLRVVADRPRDRPASSVRGSVPGREVVTATRVADLLATVLAANRRFAAEADRIATYPTVSVNAVERLRRLAEELRPAALARAELATLDIDLLLAGTRRWLLQQRPAECATTARIRAAARWGSAGT